MSSDVRAVPKPYPVSNETLLEATTTTSSIDSRAKFSLRVSPTTKVMPDAVSELYAPD